MNAIKLTINGYSLQMEGDNDFVVQSLNRGEVWETTALKYWSEKCKTSSSSGIILDVGAYTGVYALLAAYANPLTAIYAFEPLESNYKRLSENIHLNKMEHRIEAIRAALSDVNGKIKFMVTGGSPFPSGSSIELHPDRAIIREHVVETLTMDSWLTSTRKVELIKIDVERHEHSVLRGAERILREDHPTVFMEILDQKEAKKIFALMDDYGYKSVALVCEDLGYSVTDDRIWEPKQDRTNYIFK